METRRKERPPCESCKLALRPQEVSFKCRECGIKGHGGCFEGCDDCGHMFCHGHWHGHACTQASPRSRHAYMQAPAHSLQAEGKGRGSPFHTSASKEEPTAPEEERISGWMRGGCGTTAPEDWVWRWRLRRHGPGGRADLGMGLAAAAASNVGRPRQIDLLCLLCSAAGGLIFSLVIR
jgi:hypothetical protein